jgi:hypothetical protein
MAKRAKLNEKPEKQEITPERFREVVAEIVEAKAKASEQAGTVGKLTSQAVETYGLEKNGFTFVRKLMGMEAAKGQSALRAALDYADKAGMFDQKDAFNDCLSLMAEIVRRHHNGGEPAPAQESEVPGSGETEAPPPAIVRLVTGGNRRRRAPADAEA